MTEFRMTIPDVLASTDVLVDVQDASDSMTAEECVEYRVACEKVLAAAKKAIDLLDMQFVKISEKDVVRDGRRFYVGRKKDQERFDHEAIAAGVLASIREDYQVEPESPLMAGARIGVQRISEIYLSDSTKAKTGQLAKYGMSTGRFDKGTVRSWTPGAKEVVAIPAAGET